MTALLRVLDYGHYLSQEFNFFISQVKKMSN